MKYTPALDGSLRSFHHDIGVVVEYPNSQRSPFETQHRPELIGRVTSPQTDLFLPISSYIGIVTQVDGTFQLLRAASSSRRPHYDFTHFLTENSLPHHTFVLQGWYPYYLSYDILRVSPSVKYALGACAW